MRVVVAVNDKYLWCLPSFAYLFNKYWNDRQEVVIAGYNFPSFHLPDNFSFYSISTINYPKDKWVDGMMIFLKRFRENNPQIVLMLEDYWICRPVDHHGIEVLQEFADMDPTILRVDLTTDRLYAGGVTDVGYFDHFDIVQAKGSPYEMSLQAGLWNTDALMDILQKLPEDKHSAWDVELEGTNIVNREDCPYKIVGTRQFPLRYINGYNSALGFNKSLKGLTEDDKAMVRGMIPAEMMI